MMCQCASLTYNAIANAEHAQWPMLAALSQLRNNLLKSPHDRSDLE